MASEVLSGGNVASISYTNNTSQNVRVVINYVKTQGGGSGYGLNMTWTGNGGTASISGTYVNAFGRNIAASSNVSNYYSSQNMEVASASATAAFPTEITLAPGYSFSISQSSPYYYNYNIQAYNILIIKEDGT